MALVQHFLSLTVHVHVHATSNYERVCTCVCVHEKRGKSATADSCFSPIGPRQCSAALDGPATSNSRPLGFKKARELQSTYGFRKGSLINHAI